MNNATYTAFPYPRRECMAGEGFPLPSEGFLGKVSAEKSTSRT